MSANLMQSSTTPRSPNAGNAIGGSADVGPHASLPIPVSPTLGIASAPSSMASANKSSCFETFIEKSLEWLKSFFKAICCCFIEKPSSPPSPIAPTPSPPPVSQPEQSISIPPTPSIESQPASAVPPSDTSFEAMNTEVTSYFAESTAAGRQPPSRERVHQMLLANQQALESVTDTQEAENRIRLAQNLVELARIVSEPASSRV